jgi:hypothetical protein
MTLLLNVAKPIFAGYCSCSRSSGPFGAKRIHTGADKRCEPVIPQPLPKRLHLHRAHRVKVKGGCAR